MDSVVFFKKRRAKHVRQRENDSESDEEAVVKSKKANVHVNLSVTSKTSGLSASSSSEAPREVSSNITDSDRKTNRPGPVQARHVVPTTFIDYAPDVCKDYKQTGFCGFGDSCKFLHDREDYKAGWQLDREWEEVQYKKRIATLHAKGQESHSEESSSDEDIPFACFICREEYVHPIVTKCGHYFCEACAIKRYRKNPNCIICGAGTSGIFNAAKKLELRLAKKRAASRSDTPPL
ncbi:hypothetical protein PORY_001548 [Pneumocystis oryctolagi]|uniref:Uncharacterized protein n=1 Tax=Pneumocystis oryctolagi TaxID=42067 RepID=A0ACB7CBD5_9ASCO|nr:hypothetical protein PORY_001548 [Pneumocystis oryctolagi]